MRNDEAYHLGGADRELEGDEKGRIQAVVMQPGVPNAPAGGIMQLPGCKIAEIEIPRELAGVDLLEIHRSCSITTKGGKARLIRAIANQTGTALPTRKKT